jgi:dienelactone hydrolase
VKAISRVLVAAAVAVVASLAPVLAEGEAAPAQWATDLVDACAKGDWAKASEHFDKTMKEKLPEAELAKVWKSLEEKCGAFKKRGEATVRTDKAIARATVPCDFGIVALEARVVVDTQKKEVVGLFFAPSTKPVAYAAPDYVKQGSFHEEDVTVGKGDWALPGTVTIPEGKGPFRALVLVHGSGPHDRDETIGTQKPFRDLAWGLASRGILVLRYEKRTKAHGERFVAILDKLTVQEETVEDAVFAAKLLRARPDVSHVYVLGHSLGALCAPRIGRDDPTIDGLVIAAGPTRPLEDVVVEQYEYVTSLAPTPEGKKAVEDVKKAAARLKDPALSPKTPASELPLGLSATYWLDLRAYDQVAVAKAFPKPMLVLQGARDYQVTTVDFEGWKKALGERKDVVLKLYPDLNHMFVHGEGKATPGEYEKPGHVSAEVVEDVAAFLKK